ncbi:MAG: ABC transporter substrate-binding protein [Firmicutes bacterium]|jgi:putative ABC transport system substrate-binding protein|nr:ABC transporter substrate-binding protein [Bacillota bacterium]
MKKHSKLAIISLILILLLAACNSPASNPDNEGATKFKVGILQLAEHPALDTATQGFMDALTEELESQVEFDLQNAQGEQTNATTIAIKFVNDRVDLIMANATNAVKAAKEATSDIPVVGTSVTDYVQSSIVESNEKPGANVTGASDNNPVDMQIDLFEALLPDTEVIGIVYASAEENSEIQAQEAKAVMEARGYEVKLYTVADSNEIQTVVGKACTEVDAFYVPTDNLIASNVPVMSNITTAAGKAVITAEESMCMNGFLATFSISYYDLGYQAGLMAKEILVDGQDPAEMPIFHFDSSNLKLIINDEIAEALNIEIPEGLR